MTPAQLETRDGLLTAYYLNWLRHRPKHVTFAAWAQKPKLTKAQRQELKAFDAHCRRMAEAYAALEVA